VNVSRAGALAFVALVTLPPLAFAGGCSSPPPKDVTVSVTSVRARVTTNAKEAPVAYLSDVGADARVRFECTADAPWAKMRPLLVRLVSTPVSSIQIVAATVDGAEARVEVGIAGAPERDAEGTIVVDVAGGGNVRIGAGVVPVTDLAARAPKGARRFVVTADDVATMGEVVAVASALRGAAPVAVSPRRREQREEAP
jgi:hypothetical protein